MYRIAVLGDPHFGLRNNSKYFRDKQIEFFESIFFPSLIKNNIKDLIILGDTFDNRKNIDISILNFFHERFFKVLESNNINTYMLIGNHDIYFKNTSEINSVKQLELKYSNIKVIDEFEDIIINNTKLGLCSWITPENESKFLEYLNSTSSEILFGHFEINSFDMTPGHPCEHGLSINLFSKFKKVISGHFHIRSKKNNIEYVSTQLEHNWGDYSLEKGFALLDINTSEIEYINNPITIYEKINYSNLINVKEFEYKKYQDKIVRIYSLTEDIKNKKFDSFIENLNKVIYNLEVIPLDKSITTTEIVLDQESDFKKLISKYINQSDIIDKSIIENKLFEIFNSAEQLLSEA